MFDEADLALTARFPDIWPPHVRGGEGLGPSLYPSQGWTLPLCAGEDIGCQPGQRQVYLLRETAQSQTISTGDQMSYKA